MDNISVNSKKQRDSNLELFRIITMLLIIAHHYVVNSGLTDVDGPIFRNPLEIHSVFLLLWGAWGKIGINCFVLITGYFMCNSNISPKKFARLLFEILFYNFVINMIFLVAGYSVFSLKWLIDLIIPIRSIGTGFTSTYVVFYLVIPFLNILIQHINEKQHIRLLLLCSFTYIFLGTVPYFSVTMNYVSWFVVLYFISSYIRIYPKKVFNNTKIWSVMTIISLLLSIIAVVSCTWFGAILGKNIAYFFVTDSNTVLAVITSLCAFMFFKNLKMGYSKVINTISATTFGVFLIHTNNETMRQWLWENTFNNVGMYYSKWGYIHAIVSVLTVFWICFFIDYLRIKIIETPFFIIWDKHWLKLLKKYDYLEEKICKKLHIGE